jgi:hypothetical protein
VQLQWQENPGSSRCSGTLTPSPPAPWSSSAGEWKNHLANHIAKQGSVEILLQSVAKQGKVEDDLHIYKK